MWVFCLDQLTAAFKEVEQNFKLVGATAVEDRLQDGVPGTITALREAGIHVRNFKLDAGASL